MGKRREQKFLTTDEIEKLKAACQMFSDQLIVYGLLYTGMRVNELCHMHPGWINLKEGTILIPKDENGWHPKIVKVKSRITGNVIEYRSHRKIPILNPVLANILEIMIQNKYRLDMTPKEVWFRLNQLWRKTGLEGRISPHMLRHTCLSKMSQAGFDVTDIAAQAGHHNIAITLNTYLHSDSQHLIKSVREKGGI